MSSSSTSSPSQQPQQQKHDQHEHQQQQQRHEQRHDSQRPRYPPYAHAAAGAGGGLASVALLHPLDTLRTRLQATAALDRSASASASAGAAGRGRSFAAPARALFASVRQQLSLPRVLPSLYRGAVPASIGSVLSWACYFHSFQHVSAALAPLAPNHPTAVHLVSGSVAGVVTSVATNPIWVVKVRLQLQAGAAPAPHAPHGLPVVTRVVNASGATAPGPAVTTRSVCMSAVTASTPTSTAPSVVTTASAAAATSEATQTAAKSPPVAMSKAKRPYSGMADGLITIAREEGVRGLYRGLVPSLWLVSHGALQFTLYERFKAYLLTNRRATAPSPTLTSTSLADRKQYQAQQQQTQERELGGGANVSSASTVTTPNTPIATTNPSITSNANNIASTRQKPFDAAQNYPVGVVDALLASTGSKLVASLLTYPIQVARTRMQTRAADRERYGALHRALVHISRTEGARGLYRGLSANILRVTPQAAVTFITYEQVLKACEYKD